MKKIDVARALRDAEYRSTLTAAEQASLPAHPAGVTTVADGALQSVTGGCGPGTPWYTTWVGSCLPNDPNVACP